MTARSGRESSADPLEELRVALAGVVERGLDGLDEPEIHRELEGLEEVRRRAEARQARLAATLRGRQARRLREGGKDVTRASEQAARQVQRELTDGLHWSPSQAKQATRLGDTLEPTDAAGKAFDAGRLSPRHARVLTETLRWLEDDAVRADAEAYLLAHAHEEDPVAFGKRCRGLLAELDHESAMYAERRRRARRQARMATSEDGMTVMHGQWSGMDGEVLQTAVNAFRRHDHPHERRTAEKRTADAVVAMAEAALRAGEAPTQHGVRPHVVVTIPYESVLTDGGVADTGWSGPLPFAEVRRLLADCGVSRLLTDADGVPVEAGEESRNVPVGVWRGLQLRDGTCIGLGCDVPAAWCQVMHLETPYRLGGRLTLDTAALGCTEHHDLLDNRDWRVTWREGRPVLHPPDRPPEPDVPSPDDIEIRRPRPAVPPRDRAADRRSRPSRGHGRSRAPAEARPSSGRKPPVRGESSDRRPSPPGRGRETRAPADRRPPSGPPPDADDSPVASLSLPLDLAMDDASPGGPAAVRRRQSSRGPVDGSEMDGRG